MRHTPIAMVFLCVACGWFAGCNSPSASTAGAGGSAAVVAAKAETPAAAPVVGSTPVAATPAVVNTPVVAAQAPVAAPVPATAAASVVATPVVGASGSAGTTSAALPPVTIHLAGDSTVCNYPSTTVQEGWGMELGQFFNDKVTVDNQAVGGANVQSFYGSGNWRRIIAAIKPGDYVLMQFGANDSGTAHGPVRPPDFIAELGLMADEIRAKGGIPMFVTPSAFYQWSADGKEDNARLAPYAAACYTAGTANNAVVLDLNARGVEWLNSIGRTAAAPFYLPDRTGAPDKAHFVKAGATQMAKMVAGEVGRSKSPLAAYLVVVN